MTKKKTVTYTEYVKTQTGLVDNHPVPKTQPLYVVFKDGMVCLVNYTENGELSIMETCHSEQFLIDIYNWARKYAFDPDTKRIWYVNFMAPLKLTSIKAFNSIDQKQFVSAWAYTCITSWLNKNFEREFKEYEAETKPSRHEFFIDFVEGKPSKVCIVKELTDLIALTLVEVISSGREIEGKVCPVCGNVFIPIRSDQVYCDEKCRKKKNNSHDDNVYFKAHKTARSQFNREVNMCADSFLLSKKYEKWLTAVREVTDKHIDYYDRRMQMTALGGAEMDLLARTFPEMKPEDIMTVDEFKAWLRQQWKEIKNEKEEI